MHNMHILTKTHGLERDEVTYCPVANTWTEDDEFIEGTRSNATGTAVYEVELYRDGGALLVETINLLRFEMDGHHLNADEVALITSKHQVAAMEKAAAERCDAYLDCNFVGEAA